METTIRVAAEREAEGRRRRLALQGSVRRLFTRLHRWSGLLVMVLLGIAGATGSVLVFRDDIERVVNPEIRVVTPAAERVSQAETVSRLEARYADARVSTVTLPAQDDSSLIAYLTAKPRSAGGTGRQPTVSEAYVDPYTGRILGERVSGPLPWSRRSLMSWIVRIHYTLLLGSLGQSIMGAAAVVWLSTALVGIVLAWPAAWRKAYGWRQTVAVRSNQGPLKFNYDLHRVCGVLLFPVWMALAVSSIYLGFPNVVRAMTSLVSPVAAAPVPRSTWAGGAIVPPDVAIANGLAAVPSSAAFGYTRDFSNGWYSVRLVLPDDINPAGNSQVYVDFANGNVIATRLATDAPAGLRFLYWQFPLHSGEAFGAAGELLIAASGAVLVVLGATGCYVWWCGLSARRRKVMVAAAPLG